MSNTLQLENVTKHFDGTKAIDRVSLEFSNGKVTSLIGPNGAGKTTLFHLVGGTLRPDEGTIRYGRHILNSLRPWQIASLGVGRLFQDVRVFDQLSVLDNVLVAYPCQLGEGFWASLLLRKTMNKHERSRRESAEEWLRFVGLHPQAAVPAESLSYGQQKLLAIARLLGSDAEILLLDEPTAGVSPAMVELLLDLIRQLASQGRTVVIIEHNMSVVLDVSDWVYFLDHGEVAFLGLPDDVLGNPEVRDAYMGI